MYLLRALLLILVLALLNVPSGQSAEPPAAQAPAAPTVPAVRVSWSLQPLREVPLPNNARAGLTPIDQFLLEKLTAKGLSFSAPADPRVQIRRLYFDLIGLPPAPEVIEAFSKNPTDEAYAKIVDELLASPQYGERWARHWLDLARYGESDGFERNPQRPNSWHYRDWVIRALNEDMPYDRFTRLQLAGDILEPTNADSVKATGFLVAGIHNTVIGSNPIMQQNARQDELEDIIGAVSQTFLGLSLQCARCHDHKTDPILQTDYYRVSAALSGVTFGERAIKTVVAAAPPDQSEAMKRLAVLEQKLAALDAQSRERVRAKQPADNKKPVLAQTFFARWSFDANGDDDSGRLKGTLHGNARIANGKLILDGKDSYLSTSSIDKNIGEKTLEAWLRLPTLEQGGGGVISLQDNNGHSFDAIVYGERQRNMWVPGSNGYTRTQDVRGALETSTAADVIHMAIVYAADGTITMYRNGVRYGQAYKARNPLVPYKAGEAQVLFGLRHVGAGKGYLQGEIEEARLYDKALSAADVAASAAAGPGGVAPTAEELLAVLTVEERKQRDELMKERAQLEAKRPRPQPVPGGGEKVFAIVPRQPGPTHVLARGNVERKRDALTAGGIGVIPGKADFELKADAPEGERRAKLANWVARPDNPLFARVIVNRLWHYHFGVGIVDTPSDFGVNGGRPTHPELLDWLALKLIAEKFHLKPIHKLMVTSAAYRQASTRVPAAAAVDTNNRLLWRKSPTRLDAEPLRDAILSVAGQLNMKAGGPGYLDTRAHGNAGTTYYEPIDPVGPEFQRRTIYRFSPRGERSAVLETFDCPDPSAQTPRRQVTTTPLQALALWNNSMVLRMADKLAERATADCKQAGQDTADARVERAYRLALGRAPDVDEKKAALVVVEKHGLAILGRVLFNSNEFVVIE